MEHPPLPTLLSRAHLHTLSATAATIPEQVVPNGGQPLPVSGAMVYGYSASVGGVPTNNSGTVQLGWTGSIGTPDPLFAGSSFEYNFKGGFPKDLTQLYATGTPGDGVWVEWQEMTQTP